MERSRLVELLDQAGYCRLEVLSCFNSGVDDVRNKGRKEKYRSDEFDDNAKLGQFVVLDIKCEARRGGVALVYEELCVVIHGDDAKLGSEGYGSYLGDYRERERRITGSVTFHFKVFELVQKVLRLAQVEDDLCNILQEALLCPDATTDNIVSATNHGTNYQYIPFNIS
jgi:hypothetical protein